MKREEEQEPQGQTVHKPLTGILYALSIEVGLSFSTGRTELGLNVRSKTSDGQPRLNRDRGHIISVKGAIVSEVIARRC